MKLHGIRHQTSNTYTPQQNGLVERKNRQLLEVVRASLFGMNVPVEYWGEAVTSATYLINRTPSRVIECQNPLQQLQKLLLILSLPNLEPRVFGCTVYVHIPKQQRSKLDPRARKCIFGSFRVFPSGERSREGNSQNLFAFEELEALESRFGIENSTGIMEPEKSRNPDVSPCLSEVGPDVGPGVSATDTGTGPGASATGAVPGVSTTGDDSGTVETPSRADKLPSRAVRIETQGPRVVQSELPNTQSSPRVEQIVADTPGDTEFVGGEQTITELPNRPSDIVPVVSDSSQSFPFSTPSTEESATNVPPPQVPLISNQLYGVDNIVTRKSQRITKGIPKKQYEPDIKAKAKYLIANYMSNHRLAGSHALVINQLSSISIPSTVQDAMADPKWTQAMNEELEALQKNST
ncbi:hypothetical protein ACLB2K_043675 [Fragaria x ananassa]